VQLVNLPGLAKHLRLGLAQLDNKPAQTLPILWVDKVLLWLAQTLHRAEHLAQFLGLLLVVSEYFRDWEESFNGCSY
jgi:hypothetical protein